MHDERRTRSYGRYGIIVRFDGTGQRDGITATGDDHVSMRIIGMEIRQIVHGIGDVNNKRQYEEN